MKEKDELDESKENNETDKIENKNIITKYQLQEFNKSEEENFNILNEMLDKMKNLKEKYFFKQLGQFLGGLYNIALNREKLTGIKGFREQWKSDKKGVKGVKTSIDKFLKVSAGTKKSFYFFRDLIGFLNNEVARSNSALSRLVKTTFDEIYNTVPEKLGYQKITSLKMHTIKDGIKLTGTFESGWEPFPDESSLKKLGLSNDKYPLDQYQHNCLEMTKVVKKSILQSIRNPNLKFYNPDF